jgi:hypothetical protein
MDIVISIFFALFSLQDRVFEDQKQVAHNMERLYLYSGPVDHIFFHPLIAYPRRAFDGDYISFGFDDWFITTKEFSKVINSLYRNSYVLIDIYDVYEFSEDSENNTFIQRKDLYLPVGKRPLILSIDDLNYYPYMQKNGTVNKLVLDQFGQIATESKNIDGTKRISYSQGIIPVMETFISLNPDFSFQNGRGIIGLTGYSGVLGYRTQNGSKKRDQEILAVSPIIEKLKNNGWRFASHSYGHIDVNKASLSQLQRDTKGWTQEVKTLVGKTPLYIYPFGAELSYSGTKMTHLKNEGFQIFFGVGPSSKERYIDNTLQTDRKNIDGIAFRYGRNRLLHLFDVNEIVDLEVRPR